MAIDTSVLDADMTAVLDDGLRASMTCNEHTIYVLQGTIDYSDDLQEEGYFRDKDTQVQGRVTDYSGHVFPQVNDLAVVDGTTYRIVRLSMSADGRMFTLDLKRATA